MKAFNDLADFFNRERIVRELHQMLSNGNSISLVGDLAIGKSSLMYHKVHSMYTLEIIPLKTSE